MKLDAGQWIRPAPCPTQRSPISKATEPRITNATFICCHVGGPICGPQWSKAESGKTATSAALRFRRTTAGLSRCSPALRANPQRIGAFSQRVDFPPAEPPADGANLRVKQSPDEAE